jgi:hypothetical protein
MTIQDAGMISFSFSPQLSMRFTPYQRLHSQTIPNNEKARLMLRHHLVRHSELVKSIAVFGQATDADSISYFCFPYAQPMLLNAQQLFIVSTPKDVGIRSKFNSFFPWSRTSKVSLLACSSRTIRFYS